MVRDNLVVNILQQAKARRARLDKYLGLHYLLVYSMHAVYNLDAHVIPRDYIYMYASDASGVFLNLQSLQSQKHSRRKQVYIQAQLIQVLCPP